MRIIVALAFACLPFMASAQGYSPEQYDALKTLQVENLERDTYVFFDEEGFILDRYELKPAYTFNFSDEIERKVYLYLVYPTETEDTLGSILFYQREDVTIALPLPGAGSPPETWGKYIDDLKYTGEDESGFLACIGFVVSKEFSSLLAGSNAAIEEEGEYEYCFAPSTMIQMADGSKRMISEVSPGEQVLAYSSSENSWKAEEVTGIDIHQKKQISVLTIFYLDPTVNLSSSSVEVPLSSLTLTPGHPVFVDGKRIQAKNLTPGMFLTISTSEGLEDVVVMGVSQSDINTVYNLQIEDGAFLADQILVWPK